MRSSTTTLITLAVVLSSTGLTLSAPAPNPFNIDFHKLFDVPLAHDIGIGPVRDIGPVILPSALPSSSTVSPMSSSTPTGSANQALQSILNPDVVEPVGLIPLPVHHNNRRAAEIERRDVEELIGLFARAFDGDDDDDSDESGAFSISGIKKLLPIAKIGGSILGIGSDLHSIFSNPTPPPAPMVAAAPVPTAAPAGQVQRRDFELISRDLDDFVQLLARDTIDPDDSGAFSIGSLLKPFASIIGGLFGGGSPPSPPPPSPAFILSQPTQRREISGISRRNLEELIELVARGADSDLDLESGASLLTTIVKGVKDVIDSPALKTVGKALDTASTITGFASGLKSALTPPPSPPPPASTPAVMQPGQVVPPAMRSLNELD
ncbi:hypothetical protein BC629DRAFT_927967 [Irpex lacteus]|nr:hypothetical protein BC629DRAFT_927967 [Irpex lacteus]